MPVFRNKKYQNYTVIDNSALQNENLSWKAKGILSYLLSLPEDWDIHLAEIERHATDGITALKSGIKELREAGHIVYEKTRDDKGQYEHRYLVYEHPHTPENPAVENPTLDKPTVDNRDLQSTNKQSTDQQSNDKDSKGSGQNQVPHQKIADLYNDICGDKLPRVRKITGGRREKIRNRWKEEDLDSLEKWEALFKKVMKSPFLTGQNNKWTASLDWLIKNDTNYVRVLEGRYEDSDNGGKWTGDEDDGFGVGPDDAGAPLMGP